MKCEYKTTKFTIMDFDYKGYVLKIVVLYNIVMKLLIKAYTNIDQKLLYPDLTCNT